MRHETEAVTCCIVGLVRPARCSGDCSHAPEWRVLVLEKHDDFFRDFRGDTIHPSLDVIDELGLGERFDELPQQRVSHSAP